MRTVKTKGARVAFREMALRGFVVAGGALALGSCAADYVTEDNATVLFRITAINGGSVLQSDVADGQGTVRADTVTVTVANRPKNPSFANVPQVAMAIFVERYQVRYIRSDGRNVQGVDVPFAVSGNVSAVVDVALTGNNVGIPVEVVRAQAKLEPPLRNLRSNGGAIIFTCFAEVTLYGRMVSGQVVEASASFQIDFADFPDGGTSAALAFPAVTIAAGAEPRAAGGTS